MDYKILDFSLVLLGQIPPTLFTPNWLAKHKLISEEEGKNAVVNIISPNVTNYQIPEWGRFEIQTDRLIVATYSESHHEILRDIILSALKVLEGNNITNVGINYNFHFNLTREQYLEIGKVLAPFTNWKGIFKDPRMLSLEMMQEYRYDDYKGRYRIKVQPSNLVEGTGASFNFNNHFNRTVNETESAQEISNIINNSWENCIKDAHNYFNTFLKNIAL